MARRLTELREAAKSAAEPAPLPRKGALLAHAGEIVSLPADRCMLEYSQEDGPLSREPINQALGCAAGK